MCPASRAVGVEQDHQGEGPQPDPPRECLGSVSEVSRKGPPPNPPAISCYRSASVARRPPHHVCVLALRAWTSMSTQTPEQDVAVCPPHDGDTGPAHIPSRDVAETWPRCGEMHDGGSIRPCPRTLSLRRTSPGRGTPRLQDMSRTCHGRVLDMSPGRGTPRLQDMSRTCHGRVLDMSPGRGTPRRQ